MNARLLLVDDEVRVLEAYQRALRKRYTFDTATGGAEALTLMANGEPYHVIVSDMRMPGMDGVEFLAEARDRFPDTVRIMLTGNSDQRTAIDAINKGDIFRFLNKPCPPDELALAVEAGLLQYQLVSAERELLENTVRGTIEVFSELLSLLSPKSFGFTMQIKRYVRDVASQMNLPNAWWMETLAMLSQVGCVTLPGQILEKVAAGAPLLADESQLFAHHPAVGARLIGKVPRFENMAEAILQQDKDYDEQAEATDAVVGARILRCVIDFTRGIGAGHSKEAALKRLKRERRCYDPAVLSAMEAVVGAEAACDTQVLGLRALRNGMLLAEDVYSTQSGVLLVCEGQEVTESIREHLRNFVSSGQIADQFKVVVTENKSTRIDTMPDAATLEAVGDA